MVVGDRQPYIGQIERSHRITTMFRGQQIRKKKRISPTGNRTPASCELSKGWQAEILTTILSKISNFSLGRDVIHEWFRNSNVNNRNNIHLAGLNIFSSRPTSTDSDVVSAVLHGGKETCYEATIACCLIHRSTLGRNCKKDKSWWFI